MKQYDSQSVLTRFAPARLRFTRFSSGHENRDDSRAQERSITILCLVYAVDSFVDTSHRIYKEPTIGEIFFEARRYWRLVVN
jgi:hypothetical protein